MKKQGLEVDPGSIEQQHRRWGSRGWKWVLEAVWRGAHEMGRQRLGEVAGGGEASVRGDGVSVGCRG